MSLYVPIDTLPKTQFILFYQISAELTGDKDPNKKIKTILETMPIEWRSNWTLLNVNLVYNQSWFKLLGIQKAPCVWVTATKTQHIGADAFNLVENFKKSKEQDKPSHQKQIVPKAPIYAPGHAPSHVQTNFASLDSVQDLQEKYENLKSHVLKLEKLLHQIAKQGGISTKKIQKSLRDDDKKAEAIKVSMSSVSSSGGGSRDDDLATKLFDMVSRKQTRHKEEPKKIESDRHSQQSNQSESTGLGLGGVRAEESENSMSEEEMPSGFTSQFEEV